MCKQISSTNKTLALTENTEVGEMKMKLYSYSYFLLNSYSTISVLYNITEDNLYFNIS